MMFSLSYLLVFFSFIMSSFLSIFFSLPLFLRHVPHLKNNLIFRMRVAANGGGGGGGGGRGRRGGRKGQEEVRRERKSSTSFRIVFKCQWTKRNTAIINIFLFTYFYILLNHCQRVHCSYCCCGFNQS